jgi:uncharacterized membrane-anchored protein
VVAVALGGIALAAALALQFASRRYVPWIYWLAVAMVGVFGTMAADVLHVGLGVPYVVSTALFALALVVTFALWHGSERTVSIHSIHTRRREVFYGAAVMTTFALGTAAGDMTAITLHLGYLSSGVMFAVVIAVPAVAHWRFSLNAILAFWLAYIATRPLGASFADWMGVSQVRGGLDLGAGPVSLALVVLIVGCVSRRSPRFHSTDSSMSVPAWIVELVTSSLTTRKAAGTSRPNPQPSRARATKSRDARGAVGCGVSRRQSTSEMGVANTADTAGTIDSATIRCPPRG